MKFHVGNHIRWEEDPLARPLEAVTDWPHHDANAWDVVVKPLVELDETIPEVSDSRCLPKVEE